MPKNKIKVIDGGLSGVEGEASVIMENTRFYSNANAGEAIDGMSIGNLSCAMKSVIIKNNIFMELPINDAAGGALIQANSVSDLDLSGNSIKLHSVLQTGQRFCRWIVHLQSKSLSGMTIYA